MTITVDDETARWARLEAARRETSVSRLVGGLLREHMLHRVGYEQAMESYLSRRPRPLKSRSGGYPARTDLHERDAVR